QVVLGSVMLHHPHPRPLDCVSARYGEWVDIAVRSGRRLPDDDAQPLALDESQHRLGVTNRPAIGQECASPGDVRHRRLESPPLEFASSRPFLIRIDDAWAMPPG